MATRDGPFVPGTPCWVDLVTTDLPHAEEFYGELLGWTFETSGEDRGGYITALSDGYPVAGITENEPQTESPDVWTTYLATTDIDATVSTATAAGARVRVPAMTVPGMGTMAVLDDPAGGTFGLWQPGSHTGFGKYNEPGSVTWEEYHSKDFATTTPFYEALFDWDVVSRSDTDEFRYATGEIDHRAVAGMMDSSSFLPAAVPSHWAVYFGVPDADAALAAVTDLGGTVVCPAEDTPYGRVADVSDPTGAPLKLHQELSSA